MLINLQSPQPPFAGVKGFVYLTGSLLYEKYPFTPLLCIYCNSSVITISPDKDWQVCTS